ncbi:MAG: L,D-transpeptidase family protein [Campylobacterota bacterium]
MNKLLTAFFLLSLTLNAQDFSYAKAYLTKGAQAVEKLAEKDLEKQSFWQQQLQDEPLAFGYYQNKPYKQFVLVDKVGKELKVYNQHKEEIFTTPAVVGEMLGDKWREGDLKTPLGVYKFTRRIQHVDPFYGPLAIVTDYPNFYDKMHNKTGNGIWLHGFPMDEPFKNKTEGCVAVENSTLLQLDKLLDHKNALLITNEEGFMQTNLQEISKVMAFVYSWRNAWKYDEFDTYISKYDIDFKWRNGMEIEQFQKHKKRVFAIAKNKEIEFSNFEVTPYPTQAYKERIFKVTMHQKYRASNHRSNSQKILFIKLNGDTPTIILEK